MPKFVIHIGPSKTGTKSLQRMLFQCRDLLRAHSVDYTDAWWTQPGQFLHDPLLFQLREKRYADVFETFRRVNPTGCRIVVLSCEEFATLALEQLEVLRDAIGRHPVEIVYYCRRWSERIPSEWKQSVKQGDYSTLPEFYLGSTRHAVHSQSINYSLVWANFCKIFGRSSLKLVSYSNLQDQGIDLFRHFSATFLDWPAEEVSRNRQILEHESPTAVDTELLRALNWIDRQTAPRHNGILYFKFLMQRAALDTRLVEELMIEHMGQVEISDGAEELRLSWQHIHEFADCLVPRTWTRKRLFEMRKLPVQYVRCDYLLKKGARRELHRLHQRLAETPSAAPGAS
jgi:hypothetical protein